MIPLPPMKLVTGAAGFTGSWMVCYLLKAGYQVRAMRRPGSELTMYRNIASVFFEVPPEEVPEPEWVEGHLNDIFSLEDAMAGCDTVYHVAALVSFHRGDHAALMRINAEGTANVVNAMLARGIKKLGYVSSTAALGKSETGNEVTLLTPWKLHRELSGYALSKKRAELEVWRGMEEGLEVHMVNPGIIVGFGDWNRGSCATFKQVYRGLKFYSTGSNGFVDVRDVCSQLIEMVEQNTDDRQRLLISENLDYRRYFNLIASAFGVKPPSRVVGKKMAALAGMLVAVPEFLGVKSLFVTPEIARSAVAEVKYQILPGLTPIQKSVEFAAHCYRKYLRPER